MNVLLDRISAERRIELFKKETGFRFVAKYTDTCVTIQESSIYNIHNKDAEASLCYDGLITFFQCVNSHGGDFVFEYKSQWLFKIYFSNKTTEV